MISSLFSYGSFIAMWALPLLPAEDIYDVFKKPVDPNTKQPFRNDYEKSLEQRVCNEMGEFLKKQNIRKDLRIIECQNEGLCAALGSNSFRNGGVVICHPGFDTIDNQAFNWVFKHEIHHIKNNDELRISIAQTISFIVCEIFFYLGLGFSPFKTILLTLAVNVVTTKIFRNYMENQADKFANQHATIEELKGGFRILHALQQIEGFSFFHPSASSRIKNLEKELAKRNTSYFVEQDKILPLKQLIEKAQEVI